MSFGMKREKWEHRVCGNENIGKNTKADIELEEKLWLFRYIRMGRNEPARRLYASYGIHSKWDLGGRFFFCFNFYVTIKFSLVDKYNV